MANYKVKAEYMDEWNVDESENIVTSSEVEHLAAEWGKSVEELMEQLEELNSMTIDEAVKFFEDAFDALNEKFFGGAIVDRPQIIIKKLRGGLGAFNLETRQIVISSTALAEDIQVLMGVLVHQMVHAYCLQNDVADTSGRGVVHNKKFRDAAQEHGLNVKHSRYGWDTTSANDELTAFCDECEWENLDVDLSDESALKQPSSRAPWIKYICPKCGAVVKTRDEIHLKCIDCDAELEKA